MTMTKTAAMSIYGKNLLKYFSGTKKPTTLKLFARILQIYSDDDTEMNTWRFMTTQGQGHSLTFVQDHLDSTFSNFFS